MQTFRQPCLLLCKRRRLHRFAENHPVPLSSRSLPQNQPFRFRVSRSWASAARSRRPVTGIHSLLGLQIYRVNTYLPISDRLVLRDCRTIPLRASLHCSAYAVCRRISRSGFGSAVHVRSPHGHADPLRAVTVCPVLPDERYSRSDFGLTQLFANQSAPNRNGQG